MIRQEAKRHKRVKSTLKVSHSAWPLVEAQLDELMRMVETEAPKHELLQVKPCIVAHKGALKNRVHNLFHSVVTAQDLLEAQQNLADVAWMAAIAGYSALARAREGADRTSSGQHLG